ncbi:MAG: HAMP domain-containing histidine kinase [Deltaproteobacteria bacterium]|nr:HAMP domain-containing histidine kinase [Deltaproteobacteria bacterium]
MAWRRVKRSDLARRITLGMWLLSFVSTLASSFIVASFLLLSHQRSIDEQLKKTARNLINMDISEFSDFHQPIELETFVEDTLDMNQNPKVIRVFDPNRKLIFSSLGFEYDDLPKSLGPYDEYRYNRITGKNKSYQSYVHPYKVDQKIYYLQTVTPLPDYQKMLQYFWWQILLIFIGLLILSYLFSHWLANKLSSPVKEVAHYLEKLDLAKVDDWQAFHLSSPGDYLKTIIEGINHLTGRIQKDIFRTRQMNRYVAHEMRTPLTILQGETETLLMKTHADKAEYQDLLKSSLEEISRLSQTVDTILSIEKVSLENNASKEENIELISWLKEQKKYWEKFLQRNIHFVYPRQKNIFLKTHPQLLFRILDNLIRNIEKHTPPDTLCEFEIRYTKDNLQILVRDFGNGMEAQKIDLLNKNDKNITLSNIGLNLCQNIAEILKAQLIFRAHKKESRSGLEVVIQLQNFQIESR